MEVDSSTGTAESIVVVVFPSVNVGLFSFYFCSIGCLIPVFLGSRALLRFHQYVLLTSVLTMIHL